MYYVILVKTRFVDSWFDLMSSYVDSVFIEFTCPIFGGSILNFNVSKLKKFGNGD